MRQINCSGLEQYNRNVRTKRSPRALLRRKLNDVGRRGGTKDNRSRDYRRRDLDTRTDEFEPRNLTDRRCSQAVSLRIGPTATEKRYTVSERA